MSDSSSDSEEFESADEFETDGDQNNEENPALSNDSNVADIDKQIESVSLVQCNEEIAANQPHETEEDTWPPKVHHHHVHDEEPPFVDEDGDVVVWDDECLEEEGPDESLSNAPSDLKAENETKPTIITSQDAVGTSSTAAPNTNTEESVSTEHEIPKELLEKVSRRPTERGTRNGKRTAPAKKTFGAVRLVPNTELPAKSSPIKGENASLGRLDKQASLQAALKATTTESHSLPSAGKKSLAQESSGWGWGWGSSLLSTATAGVNALSSQVSSVLHNVEAGFHIPDPEELAKEDVEKEAKMAHSENDQKLITENSEGTHRLPGMALGSLLGSVSQLGKFVESTGSKVLTGGLETLEFLGKKTIDVLQEGDPGFKKTKALLEGDKISLSQVLREAKEEQEREATQARLNQLHETPRIQFGTLFDQQNGLVHLEALEMLSRQCEDLVSSKRSKLRGEDLETKEKLMEDIDILCTLDESDNESIYDIENAAKRLTKLGVAENMTKKLLLAKKDSDLWLQSVGDRNFVTPELRVDTLTWLCRLVVAGLEFYHKAGEHVLISELTDKHLKELAENVAEFTRSQCSMLSIFAESFSQAVVKMSSSSDLTTELFLEASSCEMYLRNALKLLVPIINSQIL